LALSGLGLATGATGTWNVKVGLWSSFINTARRAGSAAAGAPPH